MQGVGWLSMHTSKGWYGQNLKCMQGISFSIVFNRRWCKVYPVKSDRFELISPLDRSHAGKGYPYISTGHVSYKKGISLYLCWTGLIQEVDILISLLTRSHAGKEYPYISAGHVSYKKGISLYLCWTGLM